MRIGFFLQNNKQGGLDTFVLQLLQNWPEADDLVLFCNSSHPGLKYLRKHLPQSVKIISYDFLIFQDFENRFNKWPTIINYFLKRLFWATGIFYQVNILKRIFSGANLERLMVINGGYPAGDACQAATVAWGRLNPKHLAWHNFHNFAVPLPLSWIRRWRENWLDRKVNQSAQGFVSVSRSSRDSLVTRPAMQNNRMEFIYNGIAPLAPKRNSSLLDELCLAKNTQIILMLGVYEPRKGHLFIIQVMELLTERCPFAHLLICGYGSDEEVAVVAKHCQESQVATNIHLLGHRFDITNLLAQAQVLVVPSQAYESFGYVAVEAMCCRVPVVVTDVGGLPEVVEDGVCGYVVDRHDRVSFASHIEELLGDETLRKKMGEQGKLRYEKYFSAKRMASEYAELVRD